jgi:2-hydroxy-3-keto-5-methylthiopentenyl-1-phosphate phosphatase
MKMKETKERKKEYIVFCDFDGSITKEETLEAFIKFNVDIDLEETARKMREEGVTVRDGVRKLIGMIPTEKYLENIGFFENLQIREGFVEFLDFLDNRGIPIVVISGGIDLMVTKTLGKYMNKIEAIYAAKVDLSGEYVYYYSDYESDVEMVSKINIMNLYECDKTICIGDSYTDVIMGKNADIPFARDRLAKALKAEGVKYYPYESFYDVVNQLEKIL